MSFILGAFKIIILIGFLVFIHEGAHFLMAKKMGVKVLDFSIGFGKEIWNKQGKETKYSLRLIPLGGFVRMLGEEKDSEEERAFNKAPIWRRLVIIFAGPIMNITFGLLLFWILASIYNHNIYHGLVVTKRYIVLLFQSIGSLFTQGLKEVEVVRTCWIIKYDC